MDFTGALMTVIPMRESIRTGRCSETSTVLTEIRECLEDSLLRRAQEVSYTVKPVGKEKIYESMA